MALLELLPLILATAPQSPVVVRTAQELRAAVAAAKPGTRIALAPGRYAGGLSFADLRGEAGKPIVIAAENPKNPPVFAGGGSGLHLSRVAHVELEGLAFEECESNGLNVDDGGSAATPTHHLVLRNLQVERIGSTGNQDGIKLSGVNDFRVESCLVDRWGTGGGSAIDMVGCQRGVVEHCRFVGDASGGTGIQAKGGSSEIAIRRCRFENAGSRAVNLGGSTGREYFRPALGKPPHAEARDLTVEGNTFVGSDAPVAFVGVDGATVRFNTIFLPNKWALRILQESRDAAFVPCRKGSFTDNLVVFQSSRWSEGGVNVGPGTDAESFRFARNWWVCLDDPEHSRPKLPTKEKDGRYGATVNFRDSSSGDLRLESGSGTPTIGADAYTGK